MDKFNQEIEKALEARATGNEGMARVCARRAAGLAAAHYLQRKGVILKGAGAYDHLWQLANLPKKPAASAPLLERLLMRVTPEFKLPVEADLVEDARQLKNILDAQD